jgi:hypothetical protein
VPTFAHIAQQIESGGAGQADTRPQHCVLPRFKLVNIIGKWCRYKFIYIYDYGDDKKLATYIYKKLQHKYLQTAEHVVTRKDPNMNGIKT